MADSPDRTSDKRRPWWKEAPKPAVGSGASSSPAETSANDLADGESREVQGSGSKPYVLKNTGGVYSCTCPAWMHQGVAIERRTCKHLRALRGDAIETARAGLGQARAESGEVGGTTRVEGAAPPLLLAHTWENDIELAGWWMSEKLDGVRAYWDGTRLISRLGNTFYAPDWFVESLPKDMPLDGELFSGRKKFQRTVSIVRRQDRSDAWREISYLVFDAPSHGGPFEERLESVRSLLSERGIAHVSAHPHVPCRDLSHLREELARVEAEGGEGLMLRRPGSKYESGRSHTLLKVKTFHDAEARVIAHLPGAGKHKGRLGALECDLPDGTRFSVGTGLSDVERNNPPPVGTVITFRYQELTTDGVPRFPSYVGVRDDFTWPSATEATAPAPRKAAAASLLSRDAPLSPTSVPLPVPTPTPAPATSRDARVFIRDGLTWEITLTGRSHSIRRTRGEAVETVSTSFRGGALAWCDAERRIAAQLADGWVEIPDED